MSRLLLALALLFSSTQLASATPTRFYLSGILDDYYATASGVIVIDPVTGVVQPGDVFLAVGALPIYNLPAESLDFSLQSVTSTKAVAIPELGSSNGITTLYYTDAAGSILQIYISADSGSLIGYTGGICAVANSRNCIASPLSGDALVSFANGPDVPAGNNLFDFGSLVSTPEPSSLALLGTGVLSLCAASRRRLPSR